jgi:hypothetical protein
LATVGFVRLADGPELDSGLEQLLLKTQERLLILGGENHGVGIFGKLRSQPGGFSGGMHSLSEGGAYGQVLADNHVVEQRGPGVNLWWSL